MEILLKSIETQFDNEGNTTSVRVQFQGRDANEGDSLMSNATLENMDFANMTQNQIEQAARDKMAGWFTGTSE
ncbi:hypothetical protein [Marinilactibacillus psychrotolerans]|uniref:DUF1659 domain-containing protein n=1 Tax=Marinilactibacillus psychrotolerans TaxID=191770 RepID=A0A5R9C065_9LACT|nr:hypothetical protein [Marinilactibacillus psychrotolerans]TLQ06070.1 hypothetical protein FEZ48_11300 [Marinilactibacillus psychrotolerans]